MDWLYSYGLIDKDNFKKMIQKKNMNSVTFEKKKNPNLKSYFKKFSGLGPNKFLKSSISIEN